MEGMRPTKQDLAGKVLVVNLWATWCRPCRVEIPELNEIVERYSGQDVVFLALTNEGPGQIHRYRMGGRKFAYRQFVEAGPLAETFQTMLRAAGQRTQPRAVPQHTVIDPQGRVVLHVVGYSRRLPRRLVKSIDLALAAKP